ncbi:MAG: DUF2934 domain-containing protein [Patescibacteria group bacterium]
MATSESPRAQAWKPDGDRWKGELLRGTPATMERVDAHSRILRRIFFECMTGAGQWDPKKFDSILSLNRYLAGFIIRREPPGYAPDHQAIDSLAYRYWEASGSRHGCDLEDTRLAEKELAEGPVIAGMMIRQADKYATPLLHGLSIHPDRYGEKLPQSMVASAQPLYTSKIGVAVPDYRMIDMRTEAQALEWYIRSEHS